MQETNATLKLRVIYGIILNLLCQTSFKCPSKDLTCTWNLSSVCVAYVVYFGYTNSG